jgi:hypothetical protein
MKRFGAHDGGCPYMAPGRGCEMKIPEPIRRFFRRFAISNLMNYIVFGMATVYILDLLLPINLYGMLYLDRSMVLSGQIWRLLTFTILPPNSSLIFILLSLYLYWMIGIVLENQWGTVKFNMFYWTGVLGNIIAAMISGGATNHFLNLSLFLAFAVMNPDFQLTLFFFLPVKMKYLAMLDAALYLYYFITGGLSTKLMIIFALLNLFLFLGGDIINTIRREKQYWKTRRNFRKNMR